MSQINSLTPETVGGAAEIIKALGPLVAPLADFGLDLFAPKKSPPPPPTVPWIPIMLIGGGVAVLITTVLVVKAHH